MYKVAFFDLFFTLVSTHDNEEDKPHESDILGIERNRWTEVSESQMYERSIGLIDQPIDIVRNIVNVVAQDVDDSVLNEVLLARIERFSRTVIEVNEKTLNILKKIKDKGIRICLISNADVIDKLGWEESPLNEIFDEVIFSCDVGFAKPDLRIYNHAMERMQVHSKDCIFIGDGGSDELKGAREAGIKAVLTTQYRGKLWPDTVEAIKRDADHVISDIEELLDII